MHQPTATGLAQHGPQAAQRQRLALSSRSSLLQLPAGGGAAPQRRSRQPACRVAAAATAQSSSSSSSSSSSTASSSSSAAAAGGGLASRTGSPQLLEMPPRNTAAVGSTIKYRIRRKGPAGQQPDNPVVDFMAKLKLAWQIFFPEAGEAAAAAAVKPKEEAKQRLRMILVADRCGMSPAGLTEMKRNILSAIEEFVDIDSEEQIDVSITSEPEVGTVYCVAVPIRRVKPEARIALNEEGDIEGLTFEYDPEDPYSDPSSQFPYGT